MDSINPITIAFGFIAAYFLTKPSTDEKIITEKVSNNKTNQSIFRETSPDLSQLKMKSDRNQSKSTETSPDISQLKMKLDRNQSRFTETSPYSSEKMGGGTEEEDIALEAALRKVFKK